MNFRIYTCDSLPFKTINHLIMICYHQNPIRRTIGLTISPFLMMTNLSYLGEKEISPSNQAWINQTKIYEFKTEIIRTCEFSIGNNINHENIISYIVKSNVHKTKQMIWWWYAHISILDPKYLFPFGNIKNKRRGSRRDQGWGGGNTEQR